MRHGQRTAIYDSVLRIEAYRFEGIVQPFPRHFHEQYVIGIVERGQRTLYCKNTVRSIGRDDVVWFHPGDDHACAQRSEEPFDYLGFHIPQNVMLELAEEITGRRVWISCAAVRESANQRCCGPLPGRRALHPTAMPRRFASMRRGRCWKRAFLP